MNLEVLNDQVLTPAFQLLGDPRFDKSYARVALLAIAQQESGLRYRLQQPNGPARSWWQFEKGGVSGVLGHPASATWASKVIAILGYRYDLVEIHLAMKDNDLLAACMARLLLYTNPSPLPTDAAEGWRQYIDCWRPGKPHEATWDANWRTAEESLP